MSNVTVLRVSDCAVPFCTEYVHKVNSRPFPKYNSDPALFTLWMKLISNSDLENLPVKQIQLFRICEKHFTSFNVPTNFLPSSSNDELMKFLLKQKEKIAQKKNLEANPNNVQTISTANQKNLQIVKKVRMRRVVNKVPTKSTENRPVKVKRVYMKIGDSNSGPVQPEVQVEKVVEETVAVPVDSAPSSSPKITTSLRDDSNNDNNNNNSSSSSNIGNRCNEKISFLKKNVIEKISGKLSESSKGIIANVNESTTHESIDVNRPNPMIVLDDDEDEDDPTESTDTVLDGVAPASKTATETTVNVGNTKKWSSTAINAAINNWPKFRHLVCKGKKPPIVVKARNRIVVRKPIQTVAAAKTGINEPTVAETAVTTPSSVIPPVQVDVPNTTLPSIPVINLVNDSEPEFEPPPSTAIAASTPAIVKPTAVKTIEPIQLLSIRTTLAKSYTPKKPTANKPAADIASNPKDKSLQMEVDDEETFQKACYEKYKSAQKMIQKQTNGHTKVFRNIGFHVDECVPIPEFKQLQAEKIELVKKHKLELRDQERENKRLKRLIAMRSSKIKNLSKRVRELSREIAEMNKLPNDLKEFFRNQVQHNKSGRGCRAYSDKEKEMALLITGANPVLLRNYNTYFFGPTLKTLRRWRQMLEKSAAEDTAVQSIVSETAANDSDYVYNSNTNAAVDSIVHNLNLNGIQLNLNGLQFDSEHLNNPRNFNNSLNAIFEQNFVPDNLLEMEIPSDNEDTVYLTM